MIYGMRYLVCYSVYFSGKYFSCRDNKLTVILIPATLCCFSLIHISFLSFCSFIFTASLSLALSASCWVLMSQCWWTLLESVCGSVIPMVTPALSLGLSPWSQRCLATAAEACECACMSKFSSFSHCQSCDLLQLISCAPVSPATPAGRCLHTQQHTQPFHFISVTPVWSKWTFSPL